MPQGQVGGSESCNIPRGIWSAKTLDLEKRYPGRISVRVGYADPAEKDEYSSQCISMIGEMGGNLGLCMNKGRVKGQYSDITFLAWGCTHIKENRIKDREEVKSKSGGDLEVTPEVREQVSDPHSSG